MLGNQKILWKSQNWLETQSSSQSLPQKRIFGSSILRITQNQASKFSGLVQLRDFFIYFLLNVLSGILDNFYRFNKISNF